MTYYELIPAYGRDYRTGKDAVQDWEDGKDWRGDYQLGFSLLNRQSLVDGGLVPCTVNLRYDKNRKVAVVKLQKEQTSEQL